MNQEIIYNYLLDLKKKPVNNFDRARLLKEYMKANTLSIRKLAEQLNISKSTIEDWLLWNRISLIKYEEFINIGFTETEIYRYLRDNKLIAKERLECSDPLKNKLEKYKIFLTTNRKKASTEHIAAIKDLINACNYVLSYAEKKR